MLDIATRRKICEDTISRSSSITQEATGEPLTAGKFIPSQLPPLSGLSNQNPDLDRNPIRILDLDSFAAARTLSPQKIAVLNLASDEEPGGGWRYTLSFTQEEALCYSSTLYPTLQPQYYPWPNAGPGCIAGILSSNIVVFKDTLETGCQELSTRDRFIVDVISVAGPRRRKLSLDGDKFELESDLTEFREKFRLVLRLAAGNRDTALVLGALGCGAYGCPPGLIATEMRDVLQEKEFEGWFRDVVFAVFGQGKVGKRNLEEFRRVFA